MLETHFPGLLYNDPSLTKIAFKVVFLSRKYREEFRWKIVPRDRVLESSQYTVRLEKDSKRKLILIFE